MRIGPHQRVRISQGLALHRRLKNDPGQVFQIHLMDNARVGRHHSEVVEGFLRPPQKGIALLVAIEFEIGIGLERIGSTEEVHLNRVVNHQLGRLQRVDLLRVSSHTRDGVPHGGEVRHRRDSGEVLEEHPGRHEGDFLLSGLRTPSRQVFNIFLFYKPPIFIAQQVFKQDFQAEGQAGRIPHARFLQCVQAENVVRVRPDSQRLAGTETVQHKIRPFCDEDGITAYASREKVEGQCLA